MKTINIVSIILILMCSVIFLSLAHSGDLGGGGTLGSGSGSGGHPSGSIERKLQ